MTIPLHPIIIFRPRAEFQARTGTPTGTADRHMGKRAARGRSRLPSRVRDLDRAAPLSGHHAGIYDLTRAWTRVDNMKTTTTTRGPEYSGPVLRARGGALTLRLHTRSVGRRCE